MRTVEGPNFVADEGEFELRKDGRLISIMTPQKRIYRVQPTPMTEAAIDVGMSRDVFVALGEPLGDSAWSVRLQVKPLIRLVWFGALIMAFGGLLAISDRRYRQSAREAVAVGKGPAVPAAERV